jgi:hypothetical protein
MSNTLRRAFKGWYELYRETCPVCGHAGGCLIHEKGDRVACIRVVSDTPFSKQSAMPSYLHWLTGNKKKKFEKQEHVEGHQKGSSEQIDRVFRSMMKHTGLDDAHFDHLRSDSRKMSVNEIEAREYRSFPEKPWQTVKAIEQELKVKDFIGIPGFFESKGTYGAYWSISGSQGILIPYRNQFNLIEGFQYRIDEPLNVVKLDKSKNGLMAVVKEQPNLVQVLYNGEIILEEHFELKQKKMINHEKEYLGFVSLEKGNRYYWLSSSNRPNGTGSGNPAPIHVAIPTDELKQWKPGTLHKAKVAWISEGALKCDIAVDQLSKIYSKEELEEIGTTFIGLPGVGAWRLALPLLKSMGVEKVNMCYDMDVIQNAHVKKHMMECIKMLRQEGYQTNVVMWNENDGKGIDDLYLNLKTPSFTAI